METNYDVQGFLDGVKQKRSQERFARNLIQEFRGYKIDEFQINATITSQKELEDTIEFLVGIRTCMSYAGNKMSEKIKEQLRIINIRKMKKPTILMNEKDFEEFEKNVELELVNFKSGNNPTYQGIPISTRYFIQRGEVIVFDNDMF